jgi:hypothetical protein
MSMKWTIFELDAGSARRIRGDFTARRRKMQTSSEVFFGRTKK